MRIISEFEAGCTDGTLDWFSQINPVQALRTTVQAGQSVALVWKDSIVLALTGVAEDVRRVKELFENSRSVM